MYLTYWVLEKLFYAEIIQVKNIQGKNRVELVEF